MIKDALSVDLDPGDFSMKFQLLLYCDVICACSFTLFISETGAFMLKPNVRSKPYDFPSDIRHLRLSELHVLYEDIWAVLSSFVV